MITALSSFNLTKAEFTRVFLIENSTQSGVIKGLVNNIKQQHFQEYAIMAIAIIAIAIPSLLRKLNFSLKI